MAVAKFLLEHFYYGHLVHDGKPSGSPRLLAASRNVSTDLAKLAVGRVSLPPLVESEKGTWALVRGRDRNIPFVMVQTQQGSAGQLIAHYVFPTPDVLRALAGNLSAMMKLIEDTLPVFDKVGDTLKPLELHHAEPVGVADQVEHILDLMTFTKNKIPLIESVLAAIVQGTQLIVQDAPPELEQRVRFIEGLLALLPPSARFGVTFTTHSLPSTQIDAQIRFYSNDAPPPDTAVYNWAKGEYLSEKMDDDYSRYVISQLRLDAELVIQRTTALTGIAGWRLNQGDKLSDALGVASQRLRVDEALRNNQPINKDEVGRILSEDPTLTPELQIMYASHLIRFSLAMEDMSHADPVSTLLHQQPDLESAILAQMEEAYKDGLSWLLYDTLVKWMTNPLGPQGKQWVDLLHRTGHRLFTEMTEDQDFDEINDFLETMQHAGMSLPMDGLIPRIVTTALPLAGQDAKMTENLFLLAVKFLDSKGFVSLMSNQAFVSKLPLELRRVWSVIEQGTEVEDASQMLVKTSVEYGPEWQNIVLLRFAELATQRNELNLLEAPTINSLKELAISAEGRPFADRILNVVNLIDSQLLDKLTKSTAFSLLQIRLALGDYYNLGRQMINQSSTFYPGDLQIEYLKMALKLFEETPLEEGKVQEALQSINDAGVKSAPFISASVGAIVKQSGDENLDVIARTVADELFRERRFLDVIPPRTVLMLMTYHARRKDVENTIRTASLVPLSAAYHDKGSVRVMVQMYKRMNWDDRTRIAALQMLRTFIREADDATARKAIVYFGKELKQEVRRPLEVTYYIKRFMGDVDLMAYANHLHTTVAWLKDSAEAYLDKRSTPTTTGILTTIESRPGNVPSDQKPAVADGLLGLGQAIVEIGKQYRSKRSRDENKYINTILTGERDPASVIDVYRAIGGYFARGKYFKIELREQAPPDPIGVRALPNLRDAVIASHAVLQDALNAFPADKPVQLTAKELRDEIESIWSYVPTEQQTEIVRQLATDFQQIGDLIAHIEANSDERAADPNNKSGQRLESGRGRPKDTLEFFRYLRGYFL